MNTICYTASCWPKRRRRAELDDLHAKGLVTGRLHQMFSPALRQQHDQLTAQLAQLDAADSTLEQLQQRRLREHLVNVKKTRLGVLLREGLLDEPTYRTLNEQLDEEPAGLHVESHSYS